MKTIIFFCLISSCLVAQKTDTTWNNRSYWVAGTNVALAGSSIGLLTTIWYKEYPKSTFHFFDDSKEWMQMDKIGHGYSAYQLSMVEFASWRWSRMNSKSAALVSSGIAWSYMLSIECMDAFNSQWGFL